MRHDRTRSSPSASFHRSEAVDAVLSGMSAWELALLFALGVALTVLTGSLLPRVEMPEARRGIVSLQLARTAPRARALVEAWQCRGMLDAVRWNVRLDFPFLVAYSLTLAVGCLLVEQAATRSGLVADGVDGVGAVFAAAGLAAGAFDFAENVATLPMLREGAVISPARARTVISLAALKFALVVIAASWIVAAPVASLVAAR